MTRDIASDRIAEYDMKLMDIDSDTLGIPDTEYDARVTMPSAEFTRIVRDLSLLGESVRIEVSKEGVRFASDGEAANGSVLLRPSDSGAIGKVTQSKSKTPKKEDDADDEVVDVDAEDGDNEEAEGKKKVKAKKAAVKKEAADGDVDMNDDDEEFNAKSDDEGEDERDEDEDEDGSESGKKRKKVGFSVPLLLKMLICI